MNIGFDTDYNRRLVDDMMKSYSLTDASPMQWEPDRFKSSRLVGGSYDNQPRKDGEYIQSGGLPSYPMLNMIELQEWDSMGKYPNFALQGKEGGVSARSGGMSARSGGMSARSGGMSARSGGVSARSGGKLTYKKVWNVAKPFVKRYGKRLISEGKQPLKNALVDVIGNESIASFIVDELGKLGEDVLEGMGMCEKTGGSWFKKVWKKVKPVAKVGLKTGVSALKPFAKTALTSLGVNPIASSILVDSVSSLANKGIEGLGYGARSGGVGKYKGSGVGMSRRRKKVANLTGVVVPEAFGEGPSEPAGQSATSEINPKFAGDFERIRKLSKLSDTKLNDVAFTAINSSINTNLSKEQFKKMKPAERRMFLLTVLSNARALGGDPDAIVFQIQQDAMGMSGGAKSGGAKSGGMAKSGGAKSGGMAKSGGAKSASRMKRAELVKKVMREKGMKLGEASRYIKENKLM